MVHSGEARGADDHNFSLANHVANRIECERYFNEKRNCRRLYNLLICGRPADWDPDNLMMRTWDQQQAALLDRARDWTEQQMVMHSDVGVFYEDIWRVERVLVERRLRV
ncbi:MAG: hypothetical protein Q9170_004278 [Blastenia crenularia]